MRWQKKPWDSFRQTWYFPLFWPITVNDECRLWEWCHVEEEYIGCHSDGGGWQIRRFLNP